MFDFRYHLISLVAVFLALGIGVLIGVTIADTGVVSGAEKDLEKSLRGDLKEARSRAAEARQRVAWQSDFERQIYPSLVGGLMSGKRVGLIATGSLPPGVANDVREALVPTNAKLTSITVLKLPPRVDQLSRSVARSRFADLNVNSDTLSEFGKEMGRELVTHGSLFEKVKDVLVASRSGTNRRLDAVLYVRNQPKKMSDEDDSASKRLESALLEGLESVRVPVVGIEQSDDERSQITYFSDHGVTTVDNVDLWAGKVAMVYALLGAKGHYGQKKTADQVLPQGLG